MQKFAKRNRASIAAATIVLLALISGTAVSVWQAYDANQARILANNRFDEAERERKVAKASFERARQTITHLLGALEEIVRVPGMRDVYENLRQETLSAYDELLKINPNDAAVYANQGDLHYVHRLTGGSQLSQQCYARAVQLEPSNARYHCGLARALASSGQVNLEQALNHATTAIRLAPNYAEARVQRAKAYGKLGRIDEMEQEMREIERLDPIPTAGDYANLADYGMRFQRPLLARHFAEKAIALDPANDLAFQFLGAAHAALGQDDKAIAALTESMRLFPDINNQSRLAGQRQV